MDHQDPDPAPPLPSARRLAQHRLDAQHTLTRTWVDDDVRLGLLEAECADDLRLATDHDLATARAARFAPGRPAALLLNRWSDVGDGLAAMLSMRYEGGDVTRPFVDASLVNRAVEVDDLPTLAEAARRAYGELAPRYLRLWDSRPDGAIAGTRPDRRSLAAPLAVLRAGPPPPAALALRAASDARHHDDLLAAHAAVGARHEGHREQAWVQSREDLEESASAGTLFDVLLDGDWVGYVAAISEGDTLGLPAWVVQELALAPTARGHGYGRHLSTMLARELGDERPLLVGTVHAENRGARSAALAAGRLDVGGWVQLPLPASR